MISRFASAAALVLLAACQVGQADASGPETAGAAGAQDLKQNTDFYKFEYSYPTEASQIAGLKALLDKDAAAQENELDQLAREVWIDLNTAVEGDLAQAKGEQETAQLLELLERIKKYKSPFRPHFLAVDWSAAADLPGWISLGAVIETYSGGAHGNYAFDTLLWNKARTKRFDPADLFVSKAALRDAIRPEFCRMLNEERNKRRENPVELGSGDSFDECIDPLKSTLVLESSGGKAFDTISIRIAPYMAGSYAEGAYVIELPVNDAIRSNVKPEFRDDF